MNLKNKLPYLVFSLIALLFICGLIFTANCFIEQHRFSEEKQIVVEKITKNYDALNQLQYINHKKTHQDYLAWKNMVSVCDDIDCINELYFRKKFNLERWLSFLNSDFSFYQKGDFSRYLHHQNRFLLTAENSEVYDRATGLIWHRCLAGSSWKIDKCLPSNKITFPASEFLHPKTSDGWRAPTIFELITLIDFTADNNVFFNKNIFPDQYNGFIWSSTPYAGSPEKDSWILNFAEAETGWLPSDGRNGTRLVREFNLNSKNNSNYLENNLENNSENNSIKDNKNETTSVQHNQLTTQPSFSCEERLNQAEHLICTNAELAKYDNQLNQFYTALKKLPMIHGKEFRLYQQQWLAARNSCDTIACIEKSYLEKIYEFKKLTDFLQKEEDHSSGVINLSLLMREQNRFIEQHDTVEDKATQLTWKRCVEGTHWNGHSCTGLPTIYSGNEAILMFENKPHQRLPHMIELASIIDFEKTMPAMNTQAFPHLQRDQLMTARFNRTGSRDDGLTYLGYNTIATSPAWRIDVERGFINKTTVDGLVRLVVEDSKKNSK